MKIGIIGAGNVGAALAHMRRLPACMIVALAVLIGDGVLIAELW